MGAIGLPANFTFFWSVSVGLSIFLATDVSSDVVSLLSATPSVGEVPRYLYISSLSSSSNKYILLLPTII